LVQRLVVVTATEWAQVLAAKMVKVRARELALV